MKLINLKRIKLDWTFDTWGSPKNQDKLVTNVIRIWAIGGLVIIANYDLGYFEIIIFILSVMFIGIIDVKFIRNKCEKIEFNVW